MKWVAWVKDRENLDADENSMSVRTHLFDSALLAENAVHETLRGYYDTSCEVNVYIYSNAEGRRKMYGGYVFYRNGKLVASILPTEG